MIYELFQNNMLAVMCCITMIFFLAKNHSFENRVKNSFWNCVILILMLIFVDMWEEVESVKNYPTFGRLFSSVLGYCIRPVLAYFVCRAALKIKKIKSNFVLALPWVINMLIECTAFFSPIVFSYDAQNQFVRGPLGYTPFVAGAIYAITICYINVRLVSNGNLEESAIVLFIMIMLSIAVILESVYGFQSLLSGGSCLGLIFYYLYLNINISEHDILTGAKVRRSFYLDAERNKGRISAIISMDLNGLKTLNDEFGHQEGDKALLALAQNVRKTLPPSWEFYRTGGDEFMVLCHKTDEEEVKAFLKKFADRMDASHYSAATGYVMYNKEINFEKACHICDTMMYETKRQMKEEMA